MESAACLPRHHKKEYVISGNQTGVLELKSHEDHGKHIIRSHTDKH